MRLVGTVGSDYLLVKRSGCDVAIELVIVVVVLIVRIPLSAVLALFSFSSLLVRSSPNHAGCRAWSLRHFSRGLRI